VDPSLLSVPVSWILATPSLMDRILKPVAPELGCVCKNRAPQVPMVVSFFATGTYLLAAASPKRRGPHQDRAEVPRAGPQAGTPPGRLPTVRPRLLGAVRHQRPGTGNPYGRAADQGLRMHEEHDRTGQFCAIRSYLAISRQAKHQRPGRAHRGSRRTALDARYLIQLPTVMVTVTCPATAPLRLRCCAASAGGNAPHRSPAVVARVACAVAPKIDANARSA
jgi:hypothetical protein